ncbi:MAG: VPLPA-CTERM sorting domain-containing protein [Gammaproteobacteria bacterium]|nr:VPLPA-CTERM sorting domain-containing protein [Gammaproteobacteria bacterium]
MTKRISTILSGAVLWVAFSMNAQALTVDYTGTVLTSTGALASLVPPGTAVGGPIVYDDTAVASGLITDDGFGGAPGILSVDVNVGGFCFSTGADASGCPLQPSSLVPIVSFDPGTAVTFAGGAPTGGLLNLTAFSPSFSAEIPIMFDLTAGTFFADGGGLGTASGTFGVVPIPAAAWLFGSALLGLAGLRRRK